jgi:hypothetical protein
MLARIAYKKLVCLEKRAILLNAPHAIILHESFATKGAAASPRRLRRLKPTRSRWDNEYKMPDVGGLEQAFTPDEDNFDDYLKKVSLSPWVPTPDPVARRVLDLLNAGPDDVSFVFGSSNCLSSDVIFTDLTFPDNFLCVGSCRSWLGRWPNELSCKVSSIPHLKSELNTLFIPSSYLLLACSDPPYSVKRSIGIDIDTKIVAEAQNRLSKRHPQPTIDFVIGDLKDPKAQVWNQVANASIITMYFVKEALEEIQPTLEKVLLGKKVKIATIGYAMPKTNPEWDPTWVEVILGTPIHIYELGYPMNDRLTPPDVDLPTAGDASDIKLHRGRQPFKDEYADIERSENPLVPPDDFLTEADEDWDAIPGAPDEEQDPRKQTWKKP